jgi:hypothetical protein
MHTHRTHSIPLLVYASLYVRVQYAFVYIIPLSTSVPPRIRHRFSDFTYLSTLTALGQLGNVILNDSSIFLIIAVSRIDQHETQWSRSQRKKNK